MTEIAVALVHHPVYNCDGSVVTTSVTSMDVHDFIRTCAFYSVAPVYFVHPSKKMHTFLRDLSDYWLKGPGKFRNPGRSEAMKALRLAFSLEEVAAEGFDEIWYTSARSPERGVEVQSLARWSGRHLIVFGTGWGLAADRLPTPSGWLSPIVGTGKVRHLSVRAALAIYLDRLRGR